MTAALLSSQSFIAATRNVSLDSSSSSLHSSGISSLRVTSRSCTEVSRTCVLVIARVGGNRPAGVRPRPRPTKMVKNMLPQEEDLPPMNEQIRSETVRLLGEDNSMMGIVPTGEALAQAREAGVDLVMIAADASPPVARIMDYSKYRYEQQKKKREAQKKAAANRQELKELKMRYNIDIADYNVRLKQATRFLGDGDKVKVTSQFRGREMEFKDLGLKLFERLANDVAEIGVVESRAQMDGRSLHMVLVPNKAALQRAAAAEDKAKRVAEKAKKGEGKGDVVNGAAANRIEEGEGDSSGGAMKEGDEEIVLLG